MVWYAHLFQNFPQFIAKYIMCNTELDESQAGVKISRRNINILR